MSTGDPVSREEISIQYGASPRTAPLNRLFRRLFGQLLVAIFWLYKRLISTPLHLLAGPQSGCRFYPTCSAYAIEAVRTHGPLTGLWLAVRRFVRCTPLHPGGVDFVPPPHALRPRCVRTS